MTSYRDLGVGKDHHEIKITRETTNPALLPGGRLPWACVFTTSKLAHELHPQNFGSNVHTVCQASTSSA